MDFSNSFSIKMQSSQSPYFKPLLGAALSGTIATVAAAIFVNYASLISADTASIALPVAFCTLFAATTSVSMVALYLLVRKNPLQPAAKKYIEYLEKPIEIKKYLNLQKFNNSINSMLNNPLLGITVERLKILIHLNLKLIVKQTENANTAPELQNKLNQLSNQINDTFRTPAAHKLAFELQGIAQGIFSKTKGNIKHIPFEILQKILAELTPKGKKVYGKGVVPSRLENPMLVSKNLKSIAETVKKGWVNEEMISLRAHGYCKTPEDAINYVIKNRLLSANLSEFTYQPGLDLLKLSKGCPQLTHLATHFISDNGIRDLKGMSLKHVDFSSCDQLTDKGLEHLKGMPLTSVNFQFCKELTDKGLEHLKGMPLTHVNFRYYPRLTDKGLEHLKGMPLTHVNFRSCYQLTDKGLEHLKGMSFTSVSFNDCNQLTDKNLEHLKGMPLTSVNFRRCNQLTDKGLEHLKGMPLKYVNFSGCYQLTDKGLEHLKGMRLKHVAFGYYPRLTDKGLEHLRGMPLKYVKFNGCDQLTDKGLEHLRGMPLKYVNFGECKTLTDKSLEHLKGMPLTDVNFWRCDQLTDRGLKYLKGMPLESVYFSDCKQLTDKGLEHLKGIPLTDVDFSDCPEISDKGLEHLKGMPLKYVNF